MITDAILEAAMRAYYGIEADGTTDDTDAFNFAIQSPISATRMRAALEAAEAAAQSPPISTGREIHDESPVPYRIVKPPITPAR